MPATPSMKATALSTVYLDNQRVGLMGDPAPVVAKILAAGGRALEAVEVVRSGSPTDTRGTRLGLDDVVDRTADPTKPIYLVCKRRERTPEAPAIGYITWPLPAPEPRGPLPPQPSAGPPRPEPAPGGIEGPGADAGPTDPPA